MVVFSYLFLILHLLGLALGLGSATVKTVLLLRSKSDYDSHLSYFKVVKPITKLLIAGMILLTVSGIGWLVMGYSFNLLLIIKIVLVALMWVTGPIIDNVFEPKVQKSLTSPEAILSSEFRIARKQYVTIEIVATAMMYAITLMGVFL